MNEAETRAEHIDPALKAAGWGVVEGMGEVTANAARPTAFISYASQDAALANAVVGRWSNQESLGAGESFGASRALAHFHTLCGDTDAAAVWCERAVEERDPSFLTFLQSKSGEPLRSSPRWPRLAALLNLPPS